MAREEIVKQVAFLGRGISDISFTDERTLVFSAPVDEGERLGGEARVLAERMQRSLRKLERKVVYRSPTCDHPVFLGDGTVPGADFESDGIVLLTGTAARLFEYFDRRFAEFGRAWNPERMRAPTLIPTDVLSRCDYFRSFPHIVTFATHLPEDPRRVDDFRQRHDQRETLDDQAIGDMVTPSACLSPAVCYHAYYANRGRALDGVLAYSMIGKCFRYESSNTRDLRRMWDFTMRELVFLGDRDGVLGERSKGVERFQPFLEEHRLAGDIRTASDPFFVAPDSAAKTYFQISSETKFEISLALPDGERLAVGSFNHHGDFFGKAFDVTVPGGGPMHSVCVAWGLERWVYAFVQQHGTDPSRWPDVVRNAPEFGG